MNVFSTTAKESGCGFDFDFGWHDDAMQQLH